MGLNWVRKSWAGVLRVFGYHDPFYKESRQDIGMLKAALFPLLALGFGTTFLIGWKSDAVGPVMLWATACFAAGATGGFLFAIPRSGSSARQQNGEKGAAVAGVRATDETSIDKGRPNTNLEEVSDWLTKILVGLSLVNLGEIKRHVSLIGQMVAASLNSTPKNTDVSVGIALVIGFPVIGFLCGYLYTRLILQGAIIRSDKSAYGYDKVVAAELSQKVTGSELARGEPVVPSSIDRQSAVRILEVAPVNRPNELLAPLRALAAEYERVRQDMHYGDVRTRKMAEIANDMRKLALAAAPHLSLLTKSMSPGERLAAVIILQMQFDPDYIEWLANCLADEPAFVGYQAISALLARIRTVGGPEAQRIRAAITAANTKRSELGLKPEASLDALVAQVLDEE